MEVQLNLWEAVESAFAQHNGCHLHDEAYSLLTNDWQRLLNLKTDHLSPGVFDDLVSFGVADFLVEAIGSINEDGIFKTRGCRQWYRLGTGMRASVEVTE